MKNSRTKTRVAILAIMCMALTVDVATGADSNRRLLPFQGRLTDSNGVPVSGTHNLTFSLYTEPDAQNYKWAESLSTTLSDGRFGLVLGRSTSFDNPDGDPYTPAVCFAVPLYMGIKVGTDDEMRPRKQVVPALYAYDANFATYAGEALNLKGVVHVEDGKVGIGTYGPTEKLDVAGNVAISGDATVSGNATIGDATIGDATISDANIGNATISNATISGKVIGGLEISHDGATADLVVDANGNVGIGTTSPLAALDVNGTAKIAAWNDQQLSTEGYTWIGNILFIWGAQTSTSDSPHTYYFNGSGTTFPHQCFTVQATLPGLIYSISQSSFVLDRMNDYDGTQYFNFLAIGY